MAKCHCGDCDALTRLLSVAAFSFFWGGGIVAAGAKRWVIRVKWGILRGRGKSFFRWIQKGTLHTRFCWQVFHLANIITHATSILKVICTYHSLKISYLILVLGLHKLIRKYRKHYVLNENYIFGNAACISHVGVGGMLTKATGWTGSFRASNSCRRRKYEGWNFNSGNYLFTTDTK